MAPRKEPQPGVLRVFNSRQEIRAFYDKISKVYDVLAERSEAPVRRAGLEMLAAQPGEVVLEVGFGTGHCLVALAEAVGPKGAVLGVDLSGGMLEQTRGLLEKKGLDSRVHLALADAVQLPYTTGALDGVFMSFTLELFDTPEIPVVLGECRRVLRPGGRIAVVSLTKEGRQGLLIQAYEWTHRHFPNLLDCRPIYVRQAVEEAGYTIRDDRQMQMWVPVGLILGEKPEKPLE
jgi:demethylmenaquinone methyltransferase/2-methoxy-6-polyprenyl-1,4-benzoquinol methylase